MRWFEVRIPQKNNPSQIETALVQARDSMAALGEGMKQLRDFIDMSTVDCDFSDDNCLRVTETLTGRIIEICDCDAPQPTISLMPEIEAMTLRNLSSQAEKLHIIEPAEDFSMECSKTLQLEGLHIPTEQTSTSISNKNIVEQILADLSVYSEIPSETWSEEDDELASTILALPDFTDVAPSMDSDIVPSVPPPPPRPNFKFRNSAGKLHIPKPSLPPPKVETPRIIDSKTPDSSKKNK